ncbi:MAG: glycosyltransferase [Burkholderiales bacterium]|nr:glycosyltransferase [Burkholderiales bacterium]
MSLLLNGAVAALAAVLGAVPLLLTARLRRRLPAMLRTPTDIQYCPPASVILPCKGLDPGFVDNVGSLLHQDYPDLELLFVVATADDPAYDAIARLLAEDGLAPRRARLIVAGLGHGRAQKLTNQLAAIAQASRRSRVLVFVDSDCRPDSGFVRRLVGPLADARIGATTGYRWYHPPEPSLGSMLRSTWNAGALPFLVDEKTTHAWGGAMAIRREVYDRADIAAIWDRAVSDDLTLTVAVKRLGLKLQFVPSCIAVSYEESSLPATLEFTNRQSLISRVYLPPLWWSTAIGHASANLLVAYGAVNLLVWASSDSTSALAGALGLLLVPMQWANALWLFGAIVDLIPEHLRPQVRHLRWHYVLTAPLASAMTLINTLQSARTRRMTWRGITYELRSPTETVIIAHADSSPV